MTACLSLVTFCRPNPLFAFMFSSAWRAHTS